VTEYNPICISSGHGKYIRGASGSPVPPQLDEVDEARKVVDRVAQILGDGGVTVYKFHDNTSHDQNTNLNTIVNWHNSQPAHDLDVSVHFNAYDGSAHGVECLYVSQASLAAEVSLAIAVAGGFTNRGPKKRTDLFFLNNTAEPAILIETCFCDNTSDSNLYHQYFEAICLTIAEAIAGKALLEQPPLPEERPPIDRPPPDRPPSPEPGPPDAIPRPTIGRGDYGHNVRELQIALQTAVDGDFGPQTEAAVHGYQSREHLSVDGMVGPQTWPHWTWISACRPIHLSCRRCSRHQCSKPSPPSPARARSRAIIGATAVRHRAVISTAWRSHMPRSACGCPTRSHRHGDGKGRYRR
jgi:N-acetylmuramoyl-L-alanine amidase